MIGSVVTALVGLVCIFIGISNRRGNIESLHSYHRSRVSEADRIPFGRAVGLGMIIVGISILIFGALSIAALLFEMESLTLVGTGIMIAGLAVGLVIAFRAMIKYNKGIF